jgi:hypothetical protein
MIGAVVGRERVTVGAEAAPQLVPRIARSLRGVAWSAQSLKVPRVVRPARM